MIVTVESSSSGASSLEEKEEKGEMMLFQKFVWNFCILGNKVMTMTGMYNTYLRRLICLRKIHWYKIFLLIGDLNDVLWLAQVHYNTGQYVSAQKLILESYRFKRCMPISSGKVLCEYELISKCSIAIRKQCMS